MSIPRLHPDVAKKVEELEGLKRRLCQSIERMNHLEMHEKPLLIAFYQKLLGYLELELLITQVEARKVRRMIELITQVMNQGKTPTIETIKKAVEKELIDWKVRIHEKEKELEDSASFLNSRSGLSDEDSKQLKSNYRLLCKLIHPDIVGHDSELYEKYWGQIQQAYNDGDVEGIEMYLAIIQKKKKVDVDAKDSFDSEMKRLIGMLDKVERREAKIKSNPPFVYAEQLHDKEWVKQKQMELRGLIEKENEELKQLQTWLDTLMKSSSEAKH